VISFCKQVRIGDLDSRSSGLAAWAQAGVYIRSVGAIPMLTGLTFEYVNTLIVVISFSRRIRLAKIFLVIPVHVPVVR
jgi:hypothetical protein